MLAVGVTPPCCLYVSEVLSGPKQGWQLEAEAVKGSLWQLTLPTRVSNTYVQHIPST